MLEEILLRDLKILAILAKQGILQELPAFQQCE